jgi:hypothetical protein
MTKLRQICKMLCSPGLPRWVPLLQSDILNEPLHDCSHLGQPPKPTQLLAQKTLDEANWQTSRLHCSFSLAQKMPCLQWLYIPTWRYKLAMSFFQGGGGTSITMYSSGATVFRSTIGGVHPLRCVHQPQEFLRQSSVRVVNTWSYCWLK